MVRDSGVWLSSRGLLNQWALLALVVMVAGGNSVAESRDDRPPWAAPPLERAISIRESSTGETISLEMLLEHLSEADVVFLGESHTDETTHRLQLAIYQGLLDRKQQVVLALEMFDRDVQPYLDRYLAGEINEPTFLEHSRPWSNYREAYRPLVELARELAAPVRASNFPAPLLRRVVSEGSDALDSLSSEDQLLVPQEFFANSPEYWRRVDNVMRSHRAMMPRGDDDEERLYSTQSLWDNAMGDTCAQALDDFPEHLVVHINGKFHSAYGDGAVRQLQLRKPEAKIKTIDVVPTTNPATEELRGKSPADYVVFAEARATNLDRGKRAVFVGQRIEYRFHLPEQASDESPVPLLIWLHPEGLTAEEAMVLGKRRFGEEVAIAVVEAPHQSLGEDLSIGGSWYWADSFAEDTGRLVGAVEEIAAYLFRHFPLATDRICVVGEGTGATLAVVIATQATRFDLAAIAVNPRQYGKVKDLPLLLPEYYQDDPLPKRTLQIHGNESLGEWWHDELVQYNQVGVESTFQLAPPDPWEQQWQLMNAIRGAVDLEELPAATEPDRRYLLLETDSSRERHWAELQAEELSKRDGIPTTVVRSEPERADATKVSTTISPDAMAQPGAIPRCPGPFGGTTVLVVPPEDEATTLQQWLELEENDPLARESRFHRVRIATQAGPRALPEVLQQLSAENRKNVLIVPAFAEVSWLRELRHRVLKLEDTMTLHWLPGLGGRPGIF